MFVEIGESAVAIAETFNKKAIFPDPNPVKYAYLGFVKDGFHVRASTLTRRSKFESAVELLCQQCMHKTGPTKTSCITLIANLVLGGMLHAADPIVDFIRNDVLNSGDAGVTGFWTNAGYEHDPEGGYLFCFEFDLSGDGKPELFLSSSLTADHMLAKWSVYSQNKGGVWTKIGSEVEFSPGQEFYVDFRQGHPQINCVFVQKPFDVTICTYRLDADGKLDKAMKRLSHAEGVAYLITKDAKAQLSLGTETTPIVKKVLLAEYLKVPQVQWRPYNTDCAIIKQRDDPADVTALDYTQGFTMEDAKTLLQARRNQ